MVSLSFITFFSTVPSASMTRLSRSRTISNSSLNRNRSGTNTTDEQRGRSHTDVSMESASNANVEHSSSGPTLSVELSCWMPHEITSPCKSESHSTGGLKLDLKLQNLNLKADATVII